MKRPKDDSLEEREKKNLFFLLRLGRSQNEFCASDAH
jgi:hypothetical protein